MTPADLFGGNHMAQQLFAEVKRVIDSIGVNEFRVTKSQAAFRRKRIFAWVWMPSQYLLGEVAPLVLSISLNTRDRSPRWKEVVEPSPGHFMHHLELRELDDLDAQVVRW